VPTTSYWLEERADALAAPATAGSVDVAVIGGGVTGCSCALTLARHGVSVRVYEARTVAGGASGRNGGFALRGSAEPYDVARERLGREAARDLWVLTQETLDRLADLAGDAFRRVGSLRLAADRAERDTLEREHAALREDDLAVEWVDELAPPLDALFAGAILHPFDGALHPARWVRRLASIAAAAGAELVEGVHAEVEDVDADTVVVAVDGSTSAVLPEVTDVLWPVRGQVLVTEPLRERLFPRPHYARGGYDYWQQLPDARLLVGGRRDTSAEAENTADDATTTPAIQRQLESLTAALLDRLPAVTHRWSGVWGTTPDLLPLVGRVPGRDRVWIAGGYAGHGNVLGLACGDAVARAVLGEPAPEIALFDPARFISDDGR
jgi:glycine/D-amino acid oxidase-like deaminating enzyme